MMEAVSSIEVLLAGIEETTTETGLSVETHLIERVYATKIRASDEEMALLVIESHATCPQWNYTIRPRQIGKIFLDRPYVFRRELIEPWHLVEDSTLPQLEDGSSASSQNTVSSPDTASSADPLPF